LSQFFKTILEPNEAYLHKEKKSKFYGHAFPLSNKEAIEEIIASLKEQYSNANHFCYAWQIGVNQPIYKLNDDGEPNNTAGAPIYGQIQSFELTNVVVVIVRIFGGVKLGPGGLITAYKAAAKGALEQAKIITSEIKDLYSLEFPYSKMHAVIRIVQSQKGTILEQFVENTCKMKISLSKSRSNNFEEKIIESRICHYKKLEITH
jgi:uncharacterized YigZ family protein